VSNQISIRRAARRDVATLAKFNRAMARETEGKHLKAKRAAAGVAGLLEHPEYGFYVIAEAAGQVVGSLMVTYEWSDWRNGMYWWIQSVYVPPEQRRQGIYRKLYGQVKRLARRQGNVAGIRLYVAKDNARAQQTYRSLGMTKAAYEVFEELFSA
jgi:ribosomal protein S18 acetylase RimI-like enzyme